jgi:hypothetical protein
MHKKSSPCSFGLSATSQQYFSLRTNQPLATSQQYFSLKTNQHQPSATSQTNMLHDFEIGEKPLVSMRLMQHLPLVEFGERKMTRLLHENVKDSFYR